MSHPASPWGRYRNGTDLPRDRARELCRWRVSSVTAPPGRPTESPLENQLRALRARNILHGQSSFALEYCSASLVVRRLPRRPSSRIQSPSSRVTAVPSFDQPTHICVGEPAIPSIARPCPHRPPANRQTKSSSSAFARVSVVRSTCSPNDTRWGSSISFCDPSAIERPPKSCCKTHGSVSCPAFAIFSERRSFRPGCTRSHEISASTTPAKPFCVDIRL